METDSNCSLCPQSSRFFKQDVAQFWKIFDIIDTLCYSKKKKGFFTLIEGSDIDTIRDIWLDVDTNTERVNR